MTNRDILQTALRQSAMDSNCRPEDFLSAENKVVLSKKNPAARKYLELPFLCDFTSYGSNIVASVSPEYRKIAQSYLEKNAVSQCFETPSLHTLIENLRPMGANVCFMAEYFLPDVEKIRPTACSYELRVLHKQELSPLYLSQWSNALCEKRKELDMLAVGAYDSGKLIGLAGASADCDTMWQIGIDVLPAYRKQGIACALTSRLAAEILQLGKVPFYCAAWSNLPSVRNAIAAGFKPAWVQMTVKSQQFIAGML